MDSALPVTLLNQEWTNTNPLSLASELALLEPDIPLYFPYSQLALLDLYSYISDDVPLVPGIPTCW